MKYPRHPSKPTPPSPVDLKPTPRGLKAGEMKIYGVSAALALWESRASDIIRVYIAENRLKEFGGLLKWCAKQKKAYHILTPKELEAVSGSVHHEGVVFIAKSRLELEDEEFYLALEKLPKSCLLVYLDGVQNPHNVGAIMRTAAHFGVPYLLGKKGNLKSIGSAGYRIAEGGAEHCQLVTLSDPKKAIDTLRAKNFKILATDANADHALGQSPLPERVLFILGGEVEGVSDLMLGRSDLTVRIPGTGHVESLNVSVATGILMSHFFAK